MNTTVIVVEPLDSSMELVRLIKNSSCEEVMELEMFKNMEKIIVQEKSQRFGGKHHACPLLISPRIFKVFNV